MMWNLKACESGCTNLKLIENMDGMLSIACTNCPKHIDYCSNLDEAVRLWNDGKFMEEDYLLIHATESQEMDPMPWDD